MKTTKIASPKIGTVVRHTGWGFEDDRKYPCDVLITDGQYYGSNGGVSNYWYWRRILRTGNLGKIEHGYGSFETPSKKYKVETTVKVKS